jgi:hypothetical protein
LQNAVDKLCDLERYDPGEEQRARVSEILHDAMLRDLRQLLGEVLHPLSRVAILIDNLDKAWGRAEDIKYLSDLLRGLLEVSARIPKDFAQSSHWRKRVNLSLSVFLRSDIFSKILDYTLERDKLPYELIVWADHQLLLRIVEERLLVSLNHRGEERDVWADFFTSHVCGQSLKEFIERYTISRPRDVILLIKTAMADAVNRGHLRVEEEDFVSAREKYSQFAFDALLAEDDPEIGKLEEVLISFAGSPPVLTQRDVEDAIRRAGLVGNEVEHYLDLLCDVNFLGIGTLSGEFVFPWDERRRQTLRVVARRVAERHGETQEQYQINPAFFPVLQIEDRDQ